MVLGQIQWRFSHFLFLIGNRFFGQILGNVDPKIQNVLFKAKFDIWTNSNIQNSMVAFILSVLVWKYSFWVNFVRKTKIVSLS